MLTVMLGIIGRGKSPEAEQPADQRSGSGNRPVKSGALHEGADDPKLFVGEFGIGHLKLCTTKLIRAQSIFLPQPRLFSVRPDEKPDTDGLENDVRRPDDQFRVKSRLG